MADDVSQFVKRFAQQCGAIADPVENVPRDIRAAGERVRRAVLPRLAADAIHIAACRRRKDAG